MLKASEHAEMVKAYMLYKLERDTEHELDKECDLHAKMNGHDWASDDFDIEAFTAWAETDEHHKRLWARVVEHGDAKRAALNDFCSWMVKFSGGQIDAKTAREMAVSPKWSARLDEIMNLTVIFS